MEWDVERMGRKVRLVGMFLAVAILAMGQLSFAQGKRSLIEALHVEKSRRSDRVSVIPMFGYGSQTGIFANNIQSQWAFGLAIDIPLKSALSVEVEGGYENYQIQNLSKLHRVLIGINLKLAPRMGFFRPYIGAGGFVLYNTLKVLDALSLSKVNESIENHCILQL